MLWYFIDSSHPAVCILYWSCPSTIQVIQKVPETCTSFLYLVVIYAMTAINLRSSTIIYDNLRMLCVWFCMLFHSVSVPCRPVDSTLTPPRNFWPWTLTTPGSLRVLYCIVWFWSVWDFEADLIEVWRVWNGIVVELERWFWKDSGPSFTRKQAKDWGRNAHACACSWTLVACCASCTWHSEHAACP